MTFIGYEIGSKAYKFMQKNASIFIATHAWFDEEKFLRAKSEDGSSKNKLYICPPDINQDQEDIDNSNYPNSDTDSDHNHDNPHDSSSDSTPSDTQEKSQSDEEHFESVDSEDEVKSDLKPKTESSDDEESSDGHSRGSSSHSSDEKSKEGSSHSDERDQGSENDSDDPFKESEPVVSEPGPSLPGRSSRVPKPLIKYGSAYGDKPAIQIEKEIKSDKAWQKAIEPKAKAMIKQAHNTFHNDLETIVKEGGNKSIHYLLAQAVDIEKNPREIQYRMILQLKDSNPKSFQEWQTAMETEIKALNDRDVWELVDLPQNRKPIKCRWVYDIKTNG